MTELHKKIVYNFFGKLYCQFLLFTYYSLFFPTKLASHNSMSDKMINYATRLAMKRKGNDRNKFAYVHA